MNCFFCGGPYHPSTGHLWTERVAACGPCIRDFIRWYKPRTHQTWGKQVFFLAATKFQSRP